ncbi:MAG: carbon-phosphorus lyase complex subunit PhnJ, partial [Pseudomonadota bacterium]
PYRVEDHGHLTCTRSVTRGFFMNEIPQEDGSATHEVSDSEWGVKTIRARNGEGETRGQTWYRDGEMAPWP